MHSLLTPAVLVIINVAVFAKYGAPRLVAAYRASRQVQTFRNAGLL
jgi:hypothetical protein